tara:strand:- start:51 stop:665 length:615 start_codon:yes stop_codon:yes gene_type:complete
MNWLAHTLLSSKSIEYQLGNLLADPMKGRWWPGVSDELVAGFQMHAAIDSFTDRNPWVLKSKARLGEKGYLKGVVIDIVYDYFLSQRWDEYVGLERQSFLTAFYVEALPAASSYPKPANDFIERLVRVKVFSQYHQWDGICEALYRLDKRLSPRILAKEKASDYIAQLSKQRQALDADFQHFFPELIDYFKRGSRLKEDDYWLY